MAFAWGVEGHQVVAQIAQSQLSPKAKAEISKLLSLEPGSSLVSISTWPDEHATKITARWHYVNFPKDSCLYVPERDCPNGDCVIAALQQQTQVLGSKESDEKRLLALKYVVHFMGDIHQPLHAGYRGDKGGNTYQVQAFGKSTNLHALWDSGLIKHFNAPTNVLAIDLMSNKANPRNDFNIEPLTAAAESCNIAHENNFYPTRVVDQQYINHYTPVLKDRLKLAGERLARLLNTTFQ
ncbi:S1/P1 nuclease [Polynucleobacter sp. JS-Polo-80-F4]|uniref:S1/P1 nuclease n=1 Tax=Polynucleobacter sp. JS-Polo-80-F4 TaxID=2576918 RepID=UPI001C0BCFA0|nr:S1/P1 nuclease [Polynucleobacter sp. JS-Polo-80-F4]MBU3615858.1 S1/P1 nuclease [Polynucleobacter sp. JS-Polo-80-F4]